MADQLTTVQVSWTSSPRKLPRSAEQGPTMDNYPQGPYALAQAMVTELQQGTLSRPDFDVRLQTLTNRLEGWFSELESIATSDDYPEGVDIVEDAKETLQVVYDGTEMLSEYADSRDPEVAAQALDYIREASEAMLRLMAITNQNIEELEADL